MFSQPPPALSLPTAGFVCDINPALPKAIRDNILSWLPPAHAIFGISEFTCSELRRLAPDFVAKIHSVPIAAPSVPTGQGSFNREYESDFYFPAAANEHKGHLVLLQAALALARRGYRFRLVLSGPGTDCSRPGHEAVKPEMEPARRFLGTHAEELRNHVCVAGDVSKADVHRFFASTRCVVLPSRYEGFGLPLAEGSPVWEIDHLL